MSYSLGINIWFDDDESLDRYLSVLSGVWRNCIDQGGAREQFYEVKLFDGRMSLTEKFSPRVGDLDEVRPFLEALWTTKISAWIESEYPYLDYDVYEDVIVERKRPLTIVFNGVDFLQGHDKKRNGQVEILFDNIGSFLVSQTLIERAATADTTENLTRWRSMIARISRNYEYVRNTIKAIIAEAQPTHLLTCTESDVHPLLAHDIYHSRLDDFAADLLKIAKLHEYGGVYFCDVEPDDPAFFPPWKGRTYGYWRGIYGQNTSDELAARLQPYVDLILQSQQRIKIPREATERCLLSSPDITAEKIGDSYLISARSSSQYYIEQPYFCLFDSLV